jgi:hypothetical protein
MITKVNAKRSDTKDNKSEKEKIIKFDFKPIEIHVKKYNLRFPIDGMF